MAPYWSVTKFKDIMTVEVNHEVYSSAAELGGIQVEDQPKDNIIAGGTGEVAGAAGSFILERLIDLPTGFTAGSFIGTIRLP